MYRRLPPFVRNFYFLTALLFVVWMLFFDQNDVWSQYKLGAAVRELQAQEVYYQQKIKEVEKDRDELTTNPELLEKFAREKYFMKRPTEDVYLVVEEK